MYFNSDRSSNHLSASKSKNRPYFFIISDVNFEVDAFWLTPISAKTLEAEKLFSNGFPSLGLASEKTGVSFATDDWPGCIWKGSFTFFKWQEESNLAWLFLAWA